MNVRDLIDILQNCNPDAEIRIAAQPNWPMEYEVDDAVSVMSEDAHDEPDDQDEREEVDGENFTETVYIVEGNQTGYLPGIVAKQVGWR